MRVGHDVRLAPLHYNTQLLTTPTRKLEGHRVIIVDTPSFDDTYEDYLEILRRIAVWLASS